MVVEIKNIIGISITPKESRKGEYFKFSCFHTFLRGKVARGKAEG